MKALLLAAGEGTRLRPLTLHKPKPMLPVGGRPMLEYAIAHLRHHSVFMVCINLHYKPESILNYFGDGTRFGVSITYSPEDTLLGSAGAARALDWLLDETFFVVYGDVLTDVDLTALLQRHRAMGSMATIVLHETDDPARCGIAEVGPGGWIQRFIEKPAPGITESRLANAGIYVVEPEILERIPRGQRFDFGTDLFPRLIDTGVQILGVPADGYVLDIGSPQRYAQAEMDLLEQRFRSYAGEQAASPALAW